MSLEMVKMTTVKLILTKKKSAHNNNKNNFETKNSHEMIFVCQFITQGLTSAELQNHNFYRHTEYIYIFLYLFSRLNWNIITQSSNYLDLLFY